MKRSRTRDVTLAATLLLLVTLLQGCGMAGAKERSLAAVMVFHKQLNAGDFNSIWNSADDAFKANSSRQQYDQFMSAVHRKLGKVIRTSTVNWSVRSHNLKTMVMLVQQTQFERGSGSEQFTFIAKDDGVKLLSYNVNSMDLITGDLVVDRRRGHSATDAKLPGSPGTGNCAALPSS